MAVVSSAVIKNKPFLVDKRYLFNLSVWPQPLSSKVIEVSRSDFIGENNTREHDPNFSYIL